MFSADSLAKEFKTLKALTRKLNLIKKPSSKEDATKKDEETEKE